MVLATDSPTGLQEGENAFSHVCQLRQELVELLLPIRKLSSSAVVDTEACHNTVDDKKAVLIACEVRGKGV